MVGIEPTTYLPRNFWSQEWELNPQPTVYDTVALPIELHRQQMIGIYAKNLK